MDQASSKTDSIKNGKPVSHKRSHGHHHTTPVSQPHPGGSLGSLCPSRKPRLHLAFPLQLCPVSCCPFLMEKEAQHHETRQGPKAHVEMHSTELSASIFARCAPVSSSPGPDRCPRCLPPLNNTVSHVMERPLHPDTPVGHVLEERSVDNKLDQTEADVLLRAGKEYWQQKTRRG